MKVTPSQQNNIQLALDIRRGRWLVSDAEALLPTALDLLARIPPTPKAIDFKATSYSESGLISVESKQAKRVAVIPIHGTLTKYSSCGTIGATTVASEILYRANDENVVGIILDIDSGGGACNAIPTLIEAIRKVQAMGKPIVAHCDLCASAAYWIASQCDAIFADNKMSNIGSIGVMVQFIDDTNSTRGERVVSVYADESPDKNLSYRKALEGNYSLLKAEMSPIVDEFHSAVKAGRRNLKADADGVLTGAMFLAEAARNIGLIDNILTLDETVENVFIRAEF